MATVQRPPVYTRVHSPSWFAVLQTAGSDNTGPALTITLANTIPRPPLYTPRIAPAYNRDLLSWLTYPATLNLIAVQPVSGIGWLDSPEPRKVQQMDHFRNQALYLSIASVKPLAQNDWPNPIWPDPWNRDLRTYVFYNEQTQPPNPGNPTKPNFMPNFGSNPQIPRYNVQLRVYNGPTPQVLFPSVSPPAVTGVWIRTAMHTGIKLDDDELTRS